MILNQKRADRGQLFWGLSPSFLGDMRDDGAGNYRRSKGYDVDQPHIPGGAVKRIIVERGATICHHDTHNICQEYGKRGKNC